MGLDVHRGLDVTTRPDELLERDVHRPQLVAGRLEPEDGRCHLPDLEVEPPSLAVLLEQGDGLGGGDRADAGEDVGARTDAGEQCVRDELERTLVDQHDRLDSANVP
eukprot:5410950-Heterocapsa_arctica.AAC.1